MPKQDRSQTKYNPRTATKRERRFRKRLHKIAVLTDDVNQLAETLANDNNMRAIVLVRRRLRKLVKEMWDL